MSELRVVGQRLPRLDGLAKARGEYIYGMDFNLEGQLYGRVVRSTEPHARLLDVDTRAAQSLCIGRRISPA